MGNVNPRNPQIRVERLRFGRIILDLDRLRTSRSTKSNPDESRGPEPGGLVGFKPQGIYVLVRRV